MNIREFQKDLNEGMSIEDACIKHKTTLQKAFNLLQYKEHNRKHRSISNTGEKYITELNGKYLLRKTVNKKFIYFGQYERLEDAVRIRDYLMEHGWNKANLYTIEKELNL